MEANNSEERSSRSILLVDGKEGDAAEEEEELVERWWSWAYRCKTHLASVISRRKGLPLALLAGCAAAAQIIMVGMYSAKSSPWQSVFTRSVGITFVPLLFVKWEPKETQDLLTLTISIAIGLLEVLGNVFLSLSIAHISSGDASVITQNLPVTSTIAACLFLGEVLDKMDILIIIINGIGLIVVSKPSFLFPSESLDHIAETSVSSDFLGVSMSVLSLLCAASVSVLSRYLVPKNANIAYLISALSGMWGIFISTIIATLTSSWKSPDSLLEWTMCIGVSLSTLFAVIPFIHALETESVMIVAVLFTVGIPLTCLHDVIINQLVDWSTLVGATLVIGSTIALFLKTTL